MSENAHGGHWAFACSPCVNMKKEGAFHTESFLFFPLLGICWAGRKITGKLFSLLDMVNVYRYNVGQNTHENCRKRQFSEKYVQGKERTTMIYSTEVQHMCPVAKGAYHGPAPIPEEGKWVQAKEIRDISGLTHGIGWCAPQQGACKLTLNVKDGVIEEALVETIGCSGMTHSAAMASEILIGKTLLEALNTDLVCDAINTAMRELFLQIVYGRTQTAFSEGGLPIGASLEDLGKGLRSQVGTMMATKAKGPRYLEMAEGYCTRIALNKDDEIIGYEFVNLGKMMESIKKGVDANEALEKAKGHYGQWDTAAKYIDPRQE